MSKIDPNPLALKSGDKIEKIKALRGKYPDIGPLIKEKVAYRIEGMLKVRDMVATMAMNTSSPMVSLKLHQVCTEITEMVEKEKGGT